MLKKEVLPGEMQEFSFMSDHDSASNSGTEMHTLDNRRQRRYRRQGPNNAQSDEIEEMEKTNVSISASTDFNYLGSLSPLQRRHKMRSFEKLEVAGFDEVGHLSDSSLPSVRQSLARSRHYEREIHEGTPLLNSQQSATDVEQAEQTLDEDIVEQTDKSRRKYAIRKYGIQLKIAILFVIMLASVVSYSVV